MWGGDDCTVTGRCRVPPSRLVVHLWDQSQWWFLLFPPQLNRPSNHPSNSQRLGLTRSLYEPISEYLIA